MLFNLKEFEYKIEEDKLKKGLRLFLNHKVEFLNKSLSGESVYLVRSTKQEGISVKKKGEKILGYNCSCRNKLCCEHLASVLFFLQQETLTFSKKNNLQKKQNKILYKRKNELEKYIKQISQIIKPFFNSQKLNEKNSNQIQKDLAREKTEASAFGHDIYFDLAIILLLPQLANPKGLFTFLINNSKKNLEQLYETGLSAKDKETWILAAQNSIRSQAYFRTGIFYFLILKAIPFLNEQTEIEKLLNALKKRKENKIEPSSINKRLIIEIILSISLDTVLEKKHSLKKYDSRAELAIALSEIEFAKGKISNGFKILELYAGKLKNKSSYLYLDLIEKILQKAKEKKNMVYEKKYQQEKFVYAHCIDQHELSGYFKYFTNSVAEADRLIQQIKARSPLYTFDKIADILIFQNRLDELILEIKKEKNKFSLIHKIALLRLPKQPATFIQIYLKHLVEAITEAKFPYFQEEVFMKAKTYFEILSKEERNGAIKILKEKMVYHKHMLQYLEKNYPAI